MTAPAIDVLGVRISVTGEDRAREILFDAAHSCRRGYVTVTRVHGMIEAQDDAAFRNNHRFVIHGAAQLVKGVLQSPPPS
ncbi:MAG: hypothetical protein DMF19_02950 [Verrucomicrobia bacterium]|nr:MAG: hypothetical protein DMF19_02950 [Verrucomicrobiota bacterium]